VLLHILVKTNSTTLQLRILMLFGYCILANGDTTFNSKITNIIKHLLSINQSINLFQV